MRRPRVTILCILVLLVAGGCDDRRKLCGISDAASLLAQQHTVWHNARATLQSPQPNVAQVAIVSALLGGRTRRRVEMDYAGPNKAEVLAKLDELSGAYQQQVMTKLDTTGPRPVLRAGVSIDVLRDAFMRLDPSYQQLEAMTRPN
jgi:hypothetical protein